jgi:hypothetical protein
MQSSNSPSVNLAGSVTGTRRLWLHRVFYFVFAATVYWNIGRLLTDQVLTRSVSGGQTIIVRKVYRLSPWLWPARFLTYARVYRCEFYKGSILWSCQSDGPWGEYQEASSATVVWQDRNTAVISLEKYPLFRCEKGVWISLEKQ